MPGLDSETLRSWRRSRGWDVPELARQLRRAARETGITVAVPAGLIRMIYAWERGDHDLSERYEQVLHLGARYAESAAWLHEDSGDLPASRYWTGRSMEWALEGGDRLMMSWVLYRRGEHAAADGDAAARREGRDLPGPMLAAISQQEAHAHALDGAEADCLATLDRALEQAASPDDPGDASGGHGSFCTPAYLEMQRGRCWLRLGRPAEAQVALDGAVRALPPVYRRDRGVALSALAAAYAALGEPREAAAAAMQALDVARDAGSERIVSMVTPVATDLAPPRHRSCRPASRSPRGTFPGA